uniref:hypothetical protein n=1 Tax=Stenotrophomonas maltophilia TaxID=40324 RepID=UPI0019546D23
AWTAAIGAGLTTDWSGLSAFVRHADRLEPDPRHAEIYRRGYRRYCELYDRLGAVGGITA